nr:hypothetical protein [Marinitoga lauensis]
MGKVTNSIVGALVMASLINGMNLIGVGISFQYIIRGAVLIAAVVFDIKQEAKHLKNPSFIDNPHLWGLLFLILI